MLEIRSELMDDKVVHVLYDEEEELMDIMQKRRDKLRIDFVYLITLSGYKLGK